MRPGTNRLLMLLIGAALAGCANQTERSSSGAGAQATAAETPTTQPEYEPKKEEVQIIDRPLEETAPPVTAAAPAPAPTPAPKKSAADEPLPDFPVTKYEIEEPQSDEVEDLGEQTDETASAESLEDGGADKESTIGEPTVEPDESEVAEEVEDLGEQSDETASAESLEDGGADKESTIGEPTVEPDEAEVAEEVEDLGEQPDESASAESLADDNAVRESAIGEPTVQPDEPEVAEEVADLGTQDDASGTASYPPDNLAQRDRGVSEPTTYADEPAKQASKPSTVSVNFEAEPLFGFDKAVIRNDQRKSLDEFVAGLKGVAYDEITAVGHADKLGSDSYNQKLSQRRANAVKAYLVSRGVPASKIRAEGRGESEPVTGDDCKGSRGKALIACLQPDRRVDVSVSGSKKN